MQRPIGVTVLAVIDGLVALFLALISVGTFFLGQLILGEMRLDAEMSDFLDQLPAGVPETFPKVLGGIFLVMAIGNAAIAVGLWALKSWAWYLNLGLQALGIFGNLGGLLLLSPISLASIAFSGFYIYYFLQPPVQQAFGIRNAF
ncbi:hypothetical protein [Leptothoe sp. PORK10 BA2]|uniref:hypothetical protein n=1 Tax=Leptothoe sp. PORK10 BA2 TaxID=3110254 RepID=UPI002B20ADA3|nr:hypothetical protein [Leptothoe sp. PORK10 BA2]MEA5465681.1 hypothetical protein [Leptothoe sp. PORK10 BA2]